MTVTLRRFRLDGIGPPGARFDPLDVDLTDDGRPVGSAVLFLENGGGKSVLLRLLFSVVLAGRRNTVGAVKFDNYVGSGDTGHVALEWATGDGTLVTGTVFEWRNRTRSGSSSNLQQFWYSFTPLPGTLSMDALPTRDGDRRLTRAVFRERLTSLAREHPALDLVIEDAQQRWTDHLLRATALDPETFRYQRQMNADEADAESLFEGLRTDDDFVRFVVEAIHDPDELADFGELVEAHATQLSRHTELLTEQQFCEHAAEVLRPLAQSVAGLRTARQAERDSMARVWSLRRRLEVAVVDEQDRERAATERADEGAAHVAKLDASSKQASSTAAELRRLEAVFVLDAAKEAEAGANDALAIARRAAEGWRSVGAVISLARQTAELERLVASQEAVDRSLEPLRIAVEVTAAHYAARLVAEAAELHRLAAAAVRQAEASDREAERHATAADGLRRQQGEAIGRSALLRQQADTSEEEVAAARGSGLVRPSEAVDDAHRRVVAEERAARDELDGVREQRTQSTDRLVDARRQLADTESAIGATEARLTADHGELDENRRGAARLVGRARVQVIAPGTTDLWLVGDRLLEVFGDAIGAHDAESRRLGLLVKDLGDRIEALGVDGLLPPSADLIRVLDVLQDARIAATSGWRWLAHNLDDAGRERVLATNPALAGGVVVNQPDDVAKAWRVLRDAGMELESVVVLDASEALESPAPGVAAPIRPALYDPAWTARTRADLDRQMDEARLLLDESRRQLSLDQELRGEIDRLLQRCSPARRNELQRSVDELEAQLARLRLARPEHVVAVEQLDESLTGLATQESEVQDRGAELASALRRLDAVVRHDHDATRWREQATSSDGTAEEHRIAGELAAASAAAARAVAATERDIANRARSDGDRRASAATDVGIAPGDDVPGAATESLHGDYVAARSVYDAERHDRDLTPQIHALEASSLRLRRELDALAADVLVEARHLATAPGAEDASMQRERLAVALAEADRVDADVRAAIAQRSRADAVVHERTPRDRPRHIVLAPGAEPSDASAAGDGAQRAQQQFLALTQEMRTAEAGVEESRSDATEHRHHAQVLQTAIHGLPEVDGADPDAVLDDEIAPWIESGARAADAVRTARTDYDSSLVGVATAAREHEAAGHRVRAVAADRAYADMGGIRLALADESLDSLADRAAALASELDGMRRSVESELADAERHREGIVVRLSTLVETQLRQLARLARLSRLPDGLGDWTGKSFLSIDFDQASAAELPARLGVVLDDALGGARKRRPIELLLAAMRAAVTRRRGDRDETFHVRMLRPNRAMTVEWAGVAELGSEFSGGMKLTAAICTYISLAALRANSRSGGGGRLFGYEPGPLFLDNPLGKASADYLLELQHAVAHQLGVQLVHTTGVWDVEALGTYDHVVRLRNLTDLRRNVRRLRVDDAANSLLPGHGSGIDGVAFSVRRRGS